MSKTLIAFAGLLMLALAGCMPQIQTTSGTDYLANYSQDPALLAAMDPQVKAAASVEPALAFPARLGLARIARGQIVAIPEAEARLWMDFAAANAALGEFAFVSPLLAAFAVTDTLDSSAQPVALCGHAGCHAPLGSLVQAIRIGAARQHVDAVLVYEVGASGRGENNILAIADLTLIGAALVPGQDLTARGVAQALLLDVRNGYPYGTAQTAVDLERLHPSWGSDAKLAAMRDTVAFEAVEKLIPEIQTLLDELSQRLPTRGAAAKP